MNDRFKSRFFHKPTGKYLTHASYIYCDGRYHLVSTDIDSNPYILISLNESEIIEEQCTGLKDKNGKLIYEGDILKTNSGNIYYIKWDEKTGSFREEDYNCQNVIYRAGYHLSLWKDSYCESYEIVGNIHENPELLEKE